MRKAPGTTEGQSVVWEIVVVICILQQHAELIDRPIKKYCDVDSIYV